MKLLTTKSFGAAGFAALKEDRPFISFDVETGKNPSHYTVHLPKPVTPAVAAEFNRVFKPKE